MKILIGLLIIAIGAFCQSSSYVPIRKIKDWSWESYWLIQGIFAWLILPFMGALLAIPTGHNLIELFASNLHATGMTVLFGALWGVGGLTFGLSMRYLGVALGQSIALGTCAGLGTILAPVFTGHAADLTASVIWGVVVTLLGIAVIGVAGAMKARQTGKDESVKEFHFVKGITVALLAGFMSACFNIGLAHGECLHFEGVNPMLISLPATLLVTLGGFMTNAVYCLSKDSKGRLTCSLSQFVNCLSDEISINDTCFTGSPAFKKETPLFWWMDKISLVVFVADYILRLHYMLSAIHPDC